MAFNALPSAVLFALAGITIFVAGLIMLIKILPGNLWSQAIEDKSVGAAIILGSVIISLAWIIAAAVH